jgi:hypothetical protein
MTEYHPFPRDRWLLALLDGWRLPFVVEPTMGHHGLRAVTLERVV